MLPEPGSCAASSGCSPGGNSAVPAQDAAGTPANSGCCRRMPRGEPRPLAGEQEPGRLEPPRWNPLFLPTLEQCRGTPGARPGLPARRALSTGRDSSHGRPGRKPLPPRATLPSCVPPVTGFEGRAGLSIFNGMLQHGEHRSLKRRGEPERASRLHKGLI